MGDCTLISGWYSIMLQFFIGFGALGSLLYKREYVDEEPKRPYEIWLMDVSKQAAGGLFIHVYNMIFGMIVGSGSGGDECGFFMINEILDTILGTFLIWVMMEVFKDFGEKNNMKELQEVGYYGTPPQWRYYGIQLSAFLAATIFAKTIVTLICLIDTHTMGAIGGFIFDAFNISPELELTLVMVFFPLIFDVIQCWIIDTFLSHDTKTTETTAGGTASSDRSFRYSPLRGSGASDDVMSTSQSIRAPLHAGTREQSTDSSNYIGSATL